MKIAVVATGKIGLPLATQYASMGHEVVGVDVNRALVECINRGEEPFPGEHGLAEKLAEQVPAGKLRATTDYADAIPGADAVVIVVPLLVDEETWQPDFAWTDAATRSLAENLTPGTLVSYETTLPVGTTRGRWKPLIEEVSGLTEGEDFHLVFSPERVLTGRVYADLNKSPNLAGGLTEACTRKSIGFYDPVLPFEERDDLPRPNGVWDMGTAEAAEMAKLSLWLTTMAKDRPFTFLDHAIHAGDSLLGITSLEQLEAFHLDPKKGRELHQQGRMGAIWGIEKVLATRRQAAIEYGRKLSSITVLDQRDANEKRALYEKLTRELSDLEAVGDLLVGATLATGGKGERALEGELKRAMFEYLRPAYEKAQTADEFQARVEDIRSEAAYLLDTGRPAKAPERRCLHWPLAFPEVFLDPERPAGFDTMVGNPPFLGGKRISGPMGNDFREYLVEQIADGRKGNADLVAYFYLRVAQVARGLGMLATNTIAQGDTREVGLDHFVESGKWVIYRAVKSRPWPGQATLEVAELWIRQSPWLGRFHLDGQTVAGITPTLNSATRAAGQPQRLSENAGAAYYASLVNGIGFVLSPAEAETLLVQDPTLSDVILRYVNGEDLNSQPDQLGSRYIVNFRDWTLLEAKRYPLALSIVEERVKPIRASLPDYKARVRDAWWQYEHPGTPLYQSIAGMRRVLAIASTSKTVLPAFAPADQVFSHATYVFAYDDDFHFGVLTSAFHWWWAVTRASTLETRIRYTPTDCFETFPQPHFSVAVEGAGKALDDHRRPLMIANNEGLTKTYNRVHNPADTSPGIVRLRELHRELDHAVRDAYGWQDLDLDHGFHETSQGVRYTIGPAARTEVLDRLLELNHQRYAEEVAAGLHDKKKGSKGKARQQVSQQATMLPAEEDA